MAVKKMTIPEVARIRAELDSVFEDKNQKFAVLDESGNIRLRKLSKPTGVIIVEALNMYKSQLAMLADIQLENIVRDIVVAKTKRKLPWQKSAS